MDNNINNLRQDESLWVQTLARYIEGISTQEETAAVEAYMAESDENMKEVMGLQLSLLAQLEYEKQLDELDEKEQSKANSIYPMSGSKSNYYQDKQQNGNTNPFISDSTEEYEYDEMSMAAIKDKDPITKLWKSIKRHWKIIVGFTVAILMVAAGIIIGMKFAGQAKDNTQTTSEQVEYGQYHANIPTEWQWTKDGFLNINWTVTNPEISAPMQEIHYKLKTNGTFGEENVETASGNGYAFKAEELENVEEIELFLRVGHNKENYETAFGPETIKITQ